MSDPVRTRVLIVSLGRRGGVTEYGWLMGRALSTQADVAVVYSEYADNAWKWQELDCPRLSVRTFNNPVGLLASFLGVGRFLRIRHFARSFSPDFVYYPGGHAWKPLLDLLLPLSARTVLTIHDPVLHEGEASPLWRAFDWLNRRRVSGYVLLNSAQGDEFLRRRHLDSARVAVIPHGIFDDYARGSQGLPNIAGVVPAAAGLVGRYMLFVGRFRPYKGLDLLLHAYAALSDDAVGPLVIAGSGELSSAERSCLESLAGRHVTVVNKWLDDAEMAALVASARFVVLPYRSATQSGVIPLASSFGVPAIATATAGLAEQVDDDVTGILGPPADVPALAKALGRAFAMGEDEHARMAEACREHARREWAWDVLAERLLEFASRLPADAQPRPRR